MEDNLQLEVYLEYVNIQISKMGEMCDLIKEGDITPQTINWALANYTPIGVGLNGEYQRIKDLSTDYQLEYKEWWDEIFLEARDKLNDGRATSKFASKSEIESQARLDNKDRYRKWQMKLSELENKVRFIIRQIDIWKKHDSILTNLSMNMRSEMKALSIEERVNAKVKPVLVPKSKRRQTNNT